MQSSKCKIQNFFIDVATDSDSPKGDLFEVVTTEEKNFRSIWNIIKMQLKHVFHVYYHYCRYLTVVASQ